MYSNGRTYSKPRIAILGRVRLTLYTIAFHGEPGALPTQPNHFTRRLLFHPHPTPNGSLLVRKPLPVNGRYIQQQDSTTAFMTKHGVHLIFSDYIDINYVFNTGDWL